MKEEEIHLRISENLKRYRKFKNWNQADLANAAGLSKETINSIECRKIWVSKTTLAKLTDALEIDVYKLFLPTENVSVYESVPEIRQYLFDNIKKIITDAYKDFQNENL